VSHERWNLNLTKQDVAIAIGIGLLAGLLNYLIWVVGHFGGFSNLLLHQADEMVYASFARCLFRGGGFIDQSICPVSLSGVAQIPHPYMRGTLFPLIMLPFFVVGGVKDLCAILPVWLCYSAIVALVYLLARGALSRWGSVLAAVLVASDPTLCDLSVGALPDLPAAVSVAVLLLALRQNIRPCLLGVLFGLAYYVKPTSLYCLPVILYYSSQGSDWKRRFVAWAKVLGGWFLVVWPWALRNTLLTGQPFYSYLYMDFLTYTPSHPSGYVWDVVTSTSPAAFFLSHPNELFVKILRVLADTVGICRPPAMWLLFFMIPANLLFIRRNPFRNALLALIVLGTVPLLMTHTEPRYFSPLLAPLLVLTIQTLEWGLMQQRLWGRVAASGAGCLLVALLVLDILGLAQLKHGYYGQGWLGGDQIQFFKERTFSDQVIASDASYAISWQCDRTTVFLPHRVEDLQVVDQIHPVDFIFVRDTRWCEPLRSYTGSAWFQETYELLREYDAETKNTSVLVLEGEVAVENDISEIPLMVMEGQAIVASPGAEIDSAVEIATVNVVPEEKVVGIWWESSVVW